jgi:undecaprenyl-diphosphatase
LILIAIIPAVIGGLLLGDFAETVFRSPLLVAINLIVFGLILYWSDRQIRKYDLDDLNWSQALIIGLVQVLALVPGVSRSGITISAARFLGQKRDQAARFSFLMLIPVLIGATGLKIIEVNSVGLENTSVFAILVGLAVSFLTSYLALVYLFELLKRVGYWPFVVYRLVLGLIVLLLIYYL